MTHASPSSSQDLHPVVAAVRRFVETEVRPAALALEHADAYPHELVARMRELGLFGALIPRDWEGLGLDVTTYARVIEEICRGFMSLAGVINSHTMAALIVLHHGTDEQRARFLPRFARGEARGGLCLTEPHAGSDVQAIRTVARRDGDHYLISGSKMFITNGREGNTFALLARTDPAVQPAHRGMSCFIVEKGEPGFQVIKAIGKLGYKGVDTVELLFEGFSVPAANLVGGVEGRGFKHVMSGLETGRINIAARAVGVAVAVLEETLRALPEGRDRSTATLRMAAKVEAARLLTYWAGGMKDRGERCDLEAGMAKLHASEIAQEVSRDAIRLIGPRSQLLSGTLERHYRDTPLMIIGEGANEIQRQIIARQLLERYGERFGALTSRDGEPEERRQIVLAVRQLVDKDVAPVAQEHDGQAVPSRLRARLAELGVFGALAPAEQGGLELDLTTATMMIEEVARGWGRLAVELTGHLAVSRALARHAGAVERERLLPAMARAELIGCPVTGAAFGAHPSGDDWRLTGREGLVAGASQAGVFLLEASHRGGTASFAVPLMAGLTVSAGEPTLGMRGFEPAALRFDDVSVPATARLAEPDGYTEGSRSAVATEVEAFTRIGAAAAAVGLAQAAFEAALRYSQQRTTFGKPICQHQAIQLKLADMATWTAAARLLAYRAAERLQAGADDADAARMAQLEAAETAAAVTLESMRIHGGYGYTTEFPVERYYRDAAALLALAGASGA